MQELMQSRQEGPRPLWLSRHLTGVLRYRSDVRTLLFIAAYFAVLGGAWFLVPWSGSSRGVLMVAAATALLCWLSWVNAIITHNVVHLPLWRSRGLNRATKIVLSLTYGFPVSEYVPGHNLSHHRYTQTRRDVMRTTKVRLGWNLANILAFFPSVAPDVMRANARYVSFARGERPHWYAERRTEMIVTWSVKIALLLVDWRRALVFVFVPHVLAVWGITTVNFLQHDGCDPDHLFNHSRNFVGRVFNWFHFNNGFHGMHHVEPGLHWSLLGERHAVEIAPYIHPALDQKSLAIYLLQTFVLRARRLRYDGAPVTLPAEGPDMDWIGSNESPALENARAFSAGE